MEEELFIPERPDYEAELLEILDSDAKPSELRERLDDYHENDIASLLERLDKDARRRLFMILSAERISEVFSHVEEDDIRHYIVEIGAEKSAEIMASMDADEISDILEDLDEEERAKVEALLDIETKKDVERISAYDENEIGSYMSTNYILISRDLTIKEAMKSLVEQAADHDNISTMYVVNKNGTFYGALSLNDLIIAREHEELEDLIATSFPYVYAQEDISDCIDELRDYSEDTIPVLDNNNRVIGVVTAHDIVEMIDEEMGEDYAKFAGLTAEEDLNESLLASMRKRVPWLVVLFVMGLGVSTITGLFEHVMSELTMIVTFQSLTLGMSGNVGTQSLAVTLRVLTDEENLEGKQKLYLVGKEIRVGMSNGLLLGSIAFLFIGGYLFFIKGQPMGTAFPISGCIGLALLVAMTISSFTGTVIPLFFNRIKVDPAVASGPLISTVNDLVAVVTYYGLAWILLLNVLQVAIV
ncbi:magnesium transporter [Lachnospiraceae bacterium 47-T17]